MQRYASLAVGAVLVLWSSCGANWYYVQESRYEKLVTVGIGPLSLGDLHDNALEPTRAGRLGTTVAFSGLLLGALAILALFADAFSGRLGRRPRVLFVGLAWLSPLYMLLGVATASTAGTWPPLRGATSGWGITGMLVGGACLLLAAHALNREPPQTVACGEPRYRGSHVPPPPH